MVTQRQRAEVTQALLQDAFKDIALNQGVEAATTQAVLAKTGLSKGALYHHFQSKSELVEAVYKAESHAAIMRALSKANADSAAIIRLKEICAAWLREVSKSDVRRILFDIGPSMIGVSRVVEIENSLSLKLFEELLSEANDDGEIAIANPQLAARLINAYVGEVALQRRSNRKSAAATIGPVIDSILQSLENSSE